MPDLPSFATRFEALTDHGPFPWQTALFERFMRDDIPLPEACDIPTGLGKTAVIPIWLVALANRGGALPRRLVYVVNRRTVVDQSTAEAKGIRQRLLDPEFGDPRPEPEIIGARRQLASALSGLASDPESDPLAISTLRGQFADNREWSADPSRPAVIVGTVDMIGSRLLFGGYGLGFKTRPLHAGFLGQDALLVHDEAHLEPAFQKLIEAIRKEQKNEPAPMGEGMRLKVMALSATPRGGNTLEISDEDRADPEVKKRIKATKVLHLHAYGDEKKLPDLIAERALTHEGSGRAVLVFARTVEAVDRIVEKLPKLRVRPLTGTMRGKEREDLFDRSDGNEDVVLRRFKQGPMPDTSGETVYLVCTSAGEVGFNISGDHLVCDLSTYESMAQRLGRVNRFGKRDDTRVDIFHPEVFDPKNELEVSRGKTLELLRSLDGDGSPDALSQLDRDGRLAAFSPEPVILPTSDILFDAWALTSIRDKLPGRPQLEPFLHGAEDEKRAETVVAWREEVEVVVGSLLEQYKPKDLLEFYPLKPHELLRDRSERVFKQISFLAARYPEKPVWLIDEDGTVKLLTLEDGTVRPLTLKELAGRDWKEISHCTILLPPSIGGLNGGLLNGTSATAVASDVADDWKDEKGQRRRIRIWGDQTEDMRLILTINTKSGIDEGEEEKDGDQEEGESSSAQRCWNWYELPKSADNEGSEFGSDAVLWSVHTEDVVRIITRIVEKLPLSAELHKALILAARCHDYGKRRKHFQRGIGNMELDPPLAKSAKKSQAFSVGGNYRHEFGSLLDAEDEAEFQGLSDDLQDLVLHLIAAHHGRGRPHFPVEEVFDPEPRDRDVAAIASSVPRRYARLQRRYGRWGLAYLESLLRAADYEASAHPSETWKAES